MTALDSAEVKVLTPLIALKDVPVIFFALKSLRELSLFPGIFLPCVKINVSNTIIQNFKSKTSLKC